MLTFGKTGVYTVRSNCCINNLGVTESVYNCLCNENLATYRTVLTFGKTGVYTIGSNCCINNLGMTESVYNCLCNENFATCRTVLTFGKTGVYTIRSNCCVNNLGVNVSHNTEGSVAVILAVEVICTVVRNVGSECTAGNCYCICNVVFCIKFACYITAGNFSNKSSNGCAACADVYAVNITAVDCKSTEGVNPIVNNCAIVDYESTCVTDRVSLTVCTVEIKATAVKCGGRIDGVIAVPESCITDKATVIDCKSTLVYNRITVSAVVYNSAILSRIIDSYGCTVGNIENHISGLGKIISSNYTTVKVKSNILACNLYHIGNSYILNKLNYITVLCCCNCICKRLILVFADLCYCNKSVNVRILVAVAALGACVSCITLILEGGIGNNCVIVVSESVYNCLCNENLATYRTVLTFGKTAIFAIRSNRCVNNLGVTLCFDNVLCYCNSTANRAMRTHCKTGFGTGGLLLGICYYGVSKLCDSLCCSADFFVTYRTVNYFVIRTCSLTGSFNYVFLNCCCVGVTESSNFLGVAIAANRTSIGANTCRCTSCCGSNLRFIIMLVLNKIIKPSILHLRSAVVRCDNTVNSYLITNNGLGFHSIVSCFAIYTIETVDVEGVALCILNIKITVLCINNFGNSTN